MAASTKKSRKIKWAIMKGKIGLYSMQLVKTLKDAEGLTAHIVLKRDSSQSTWPFGMTSQGRV